MQFQKKYLVYLGVLNFTDARTFLQKISISQRKQYLYSKQQCESCVRIFLVMFSVIVRQKITVNKNVSFRDYASGIRLADCSKMVIYSKNNNDVIFSNMTLLSCFFDVVLSLLLSLVTGPSFMSISSLRQFSFIRD